MLTSAFLEISTLVSLIADLDLCPEHTNHTKPRHGFVMHAPRVLVRQMHRHTDARLV